MLYDDALEELGGYAGIPYTFGIHDNDGASCTYAKTGRLTALDPVRPEKKSLALEQRRKQRIQRPSATIGRAESSRAHEYMMRVLLQIRLADRGNTQGFGSPSTSLLSPGGAT